MDKHYEYYDLFSCIYDTFGVTMLDTELQDIEYAVKENELHEHLLNAHGINAADGELDAIIMLF